MDVLLRLLVLVSIVYFVYSQYPVELEDPPEKPDKCHASADILNEQCCLLPPFFARDVAKKCGSKYSVTQDDVANNITYRRRHLLYGCDGWNCILSEYKFIKGEDFDDEKYYTHLERWVELNPDFADIMAKVKVTCRELLEPLLPLEPCEFTRLHFCIRRTIEVECPVLKNTDLCLKQKAFYDECREFYLRK